MLMACNPVGYRTEIQLRLNGNTNDTSYNNLTMSAGGVTYSNGIFNETNGAGQFENSYVRNTHFNTLNANYETNGLTLTLFFRSDTKSYLDGAFEIIQNYQISYNAGFAFGYDPNLFRSRYSKSDTTGANINLTKTLSQLQWYFGAYALNLNYKLICNDNDYAEYTVATGGLRTQSGTCGIGPACGSAFNSGYYFKGRIAGVKVYKRTLSKSELQILRNQKGRIRS